jgi:hypothetical protein
LGRHPHETGFSPVKRRSLLLAATALLLAGCYSSQPTKQLAVTSECSQPVWLRVHEEAGATAAILDGQRPERLDAGATYDSSVFDNDADGISIAVSPAEGDVGEIIAVPHAEGDSVRVVLTGEQCP